ncbi:MAG: DNA topoisomerase 3, partial [Rubrobacter sp.]|nr:DNA topoisomerase 3 [Rubrobacter sp.]
MKLIVAEKPSVGRDIAASLGRGRKEKGAMVGDGWTVTWALGHLAELAPPDAYGDEYKRWRLESLPILPEKFKVRVNYKTRDQFSVVKSLMRDPAVTEVVNACDAGREGELIFAYLYGLSGCKKPVKRLWISSLTPEAIQSGFNTLRDGSSMKPLEDAARSRGEADWIVGMNATRAYSVRFGRPGNVLSVGRVQTPTLKLLVGREQEIEAFKPEKFWTVYARFTREESTYDGVWFKDKQNRLKEKDAADEIAGKVRGGTGTVRKADKKTGTEKPPLLYDLTELQRNANARFGFTAERTLRIAQTLYEERKLITYPRTSSRYLSKDMIPTLKKRVEATEALPDLSPFAGKLIALDRLPISKRTVDDSKVTDHHAIIPTNKKASAELPPDEAKIYDLVARRFLAVFFPDARFENTTVVTEVREETFLSKGRIVLEAGWRALYPDGVGGRKEKEPPVLPQIERGQEWRVAKVAVKEGETKPPPRYSESALLGAMETAGKFVEDEELRQSMKDSGLGTPATRAATIERLIKVGYVERERKALVPTEKGRTLIGLLGESQLSSPELTANWERRLANMEKGTASRDEFMQDIDGFARSLVEEVRKMEGEKLAAPERVSREPLGVCPKCGEP